jgi:hypothetical protein
MQRNAIQSAMLIALTVLIMQSTIQSQSRTISDIPAPDGYAAVTSPPHSYRFWITHLPLRSGNEIRMYTGDTLFHVPYNTYAVIDMPLLFQQDLEQCADWAFRFWAEYHRQKGMLDKLNLMDYNGKPRPFSQSNQSFKQFVKWTAAHANSYSIKTGARAVERGTIRPGDMVVQNEKGGIGHVSVIMNVSTSAQGDTLLLIGYSFMPAQEFHIEKAQFGYGKGGWYSLEGFYRFLKENLDLGDPVLRRFKEP